ncbi:uncharacterized protein V1518DRAFT_426458 [Limtongia smithiae]|uniref:uncharacterized protein n=1 Tax=Limtongia smithiae TaxID=1125753 RepID=UPI0034D00BB5
MSEAAMPDQERVGVLTDAITHVREKVAAAAKRNVVNAPVVRLVAVSKLKPASDILGLYKTCGQEHFGENYVQELVEKAKVLPAEIKWHFIGSLQSNKCSMLAEIPNLYAVETVDSLKKARRLNDARPAGMSPLNVFIQVNTSGEASKSGLAPGADVDELAAYIARECARLTLKGLMTIGSVAMSQASGHGAALENTEFAVLVAQKARLEAALGLSGLELSMGMSEDYERAIAQGSTSVRVGSLIFGARPPRNGH